jgi:hypothetical protein
MLSLNLVTESVPVDQTLATLLVKILSDQLLRALAYPHSKRVCQAGEDPSPPVDLRFEAL